MQEEREIWNCLADETLNLRVGAELESTRFPCTAGSMFCGYDRKSVQSKRTVARP